MSPKPNIAAPARRTAWTRPEDYLESLARRRTARRARSGKGRTQPEAPRLLLSTLPFLGLLALLAVLAVGIMIAAFPGNQPPHPQRQLAAKEPGYAPKGWLQEAQREMH